MWSILFLISIAYMLILSRSKLIMSFSVLQQVTNYLIGNQTINKCNGYAILSKNCNK